MVCGPPYRPVIFLLRFGTRRSFRDQKKHEFQDLVKFDPKKTRDFSFFQDFANPWGMTRQAEKVDFQSKSRRLLKNDL